MRDVTVPAAARPVPLRFTAIDFETANGSPASACAVGLVKVADGRVVARAGWRIRPPAGHDAFEPFNVGLHGISRESVARADSWPEQLPRLLAFVGDDPLVAHNAPFDVGVLAAASLATGCALPDLDYVCSLRIARRAYELPSYRLPVAAEAAGYAGLEHHDPVSDAGACAAIVIDAARRMGAPGLIELAHAVGVRVGRFSLAERAEARRLVAAATFPA